MTDDPTGFAVEVLQTPAASDIYPLLGKERADSPFTPFHIGKTRNAPTDLSTMLHSSGSTGFPKPIFYTNSIVMRWANLRKQNYSSLLQSQPLIMSLTSHDVRSRIQIPWNHSVPHGPPAIPWHGPLPTTLAPSVLSQTGLHLSSHLSERSKCTAYHTDER